MSALYLTPMEARIAAALLDGPQTATQLLDVSGCASVEVLRVHMARIRAKLPAGGVDAVRQYVLTSGIREALALAVVDAEARVQAEAAA